tara:strand:+ start:61 stop:897 length:837 start_codon:yes stop_codon:yes gene_type:complete
MERYLEIDILKGIAVTFMVIYHIFYFPNQYGFKEIEYNTLPLKFMARTAQFIFITCVGINLVFSYKISKEKKISDKSYFKKNIKRLVKLGFLALFMTFFTYFVFGDSYVKFGILHFIAFSSLLLFPFVNNLKIINMIMFVVISLYILNKTHPEIFLNVPQDIAFISGFYSKYPAVDHFPLLPWLSLICFGIIIGHKIYDLKPKLSKSFKNTNLSKFLEKTGKYSLEIYMIHWLIIYLIFCHIYPKYFRQVPDLSFLNENIIIENQNIISQNTISQNEI